MDSFYKVSFIDNYFIKINNFKGLNIINIVLITNNQVLTEEQHEKAAQNEYNFDHPEGFDFDLLISTLQRLKDGKKVEVPIYNFVTHARETKTVSIELLSFEIFVYMHFIV